MNARTLKWPSLLAAVLLSGTAMAQTAAQSTTTDAIGGDKAAAKIEADIGSKPEKPDADMAKVLTALKSLDSKPLPKLTAAEARQQPSASDAAMKVLREEGHSTLPDTGVMTKNILVDGAKGKIVATVYTPATATGPLPVIVYYHGGGFVIADNATYDASPRTMSKAVNAVVVSVEYSKAPEHKFPASHDDAVAAYKWVTQNASGIGGDPTKIALAGESAGGNLVVNVAIAARDQNLTRPLHEVIVYPMAGTNLDSPSYKEHANAKPLDKPMMEWFYKNLTSSASEMQDPRLDIVGKADLHGLAPATVITDEIDPLNSEGQALAVKLKQAGVTVDAQDYKGVTHEFFGMGLVVNKAKAAEDVAVKDLKAAFATN